MKRIKIHTTDEFIKLAQDIHKDRYKYTNSIFVNYGTKLKIICPEHGEFLQTPSSHLDGRGCRKCAHNKIGRINANTIKDFMKKALETHGSLYSYDKVNYISNDTKVTITCPVHGDFEQTPSSHYSGAGCPKCGVIKCISSRKSSSGWSYSQWEEAGNNSSRFKAFTLYVIKCYSDTESFIKVGKTFMDINKRFEGNKALPYEYIVYKIHTGSARAISELEKGLHQDLQKYKYKPDKKFNGNTECFNLPDLNYIDQILQKRILNAHTT